MHDSLLQKLGSRISAQLPLLVGVILCLSLCWPLLNLSNIFYNDWTNHLWMIGYTGEFFKQHHFFSPVFNTNQMIGINVPIFYGFGFYPLNGLVSAVVGSAVAIRALVLFMFALQYVCVFNICRRLAVDAHTSCAIAVLVGTAIYPLTNVYNRSGITEFVAVTFLTCALCSLIGLLFLPSRLRDAVNFGLLYLGAALTHPLSATFGMAFLACFGLSCFPFCRKKKELFVAAVCVALAIGCVLSPWLLAIGMFGKLVHIASEDVNVLVFTKEFFFPESIDSVWNRLAPFPLDPRCIKVGIKGVSAPYMDCQINMPMLILAFGLAVGLTFSAVRRRIATIHVVALLACFGLAAFALIMSVCPQLTLFMHNAFVILQFPYRLVSYVNLGLLGLTLSLLAIYGFDIRQSGRWLAPLLAVVLTIGVVSALTKLVYAQAICSNSKQAIGLQLLSNRQADLLNVPPLMTAMSDYPVWKGFGILIPNNMPSRQLNFKVGTGKDFGKVGPVVVTVPKYTVVRTNVLTFPWNKLFIDGQEIPQHLANIHLVKINNMDTPALAIDVPPGTHTISYEFKPKKLWPQLLVLSWSVLCAWALFALVLPMKRSFRQIRDFSPGGGPLPELTDCLPTDQTEHLPAEPSTLETGRVGSSKRH